MYVWDLTALIPTSSLAVQGISHTTSEKANLFSAAAGELSAPVLPSDGDVWNTQF